MPARPNARLRALLREAAWTGADLARAVNACGAESGMTLRYDRTSVAHWLAGSRPRQPVAALVVEALSRRLDREISLPEVGLPAQQPAPVAEARHLDLVDELHELYGSGAKRRGLTRSLVYRRDTPPAYDEVNPLVATEPGRTLTPRDVSAAERMIEVFDEVDAVFGGGRGRMALGGYLATGLTPLLRAGGPPRLRARLLSSASQLAYLCGFMCFDDEQHGAAQRYFHVGRSLASEAGDRRLAAMALRALSVQARSLGHHADARRLAEGAITAAGPRTPPPTRAFLHGQLAVAYAAAGDRPAAMAQLRACGAQLERAERDGPLLGSYHAAAFAHQRAAVHASLGERGAAIRALQSSTRLRPVRERRSRALLRARLAELHLGQGHVLRAVREWHLFLDDYPHLDSGRIHRALASLDAGLRPYRRVPEVAALLHRARRTDSGPVPPTVADRR